METPYVMHPVQSLAQSPFFYYNPDPNPDTRQHGHFSPTPGGSATSTTARFQQQSPQLLLSQDVVMPYSRPPSFGPAVVGQAAMTPAHSPKPAFQKPTAQSLSPRLMPLDTDCSSHDYYLFPSTPPLSASGSAISSPPASCGVLPTPAAEASPFIALSFDLIKEEDCIDRDSFAAEDWSKFGTPPITPSKYPRRQRASIF
jgi:hypothetical protein